MNYNYLNTPQVPARKVIELPIKQITEDDEIES